VRPVTTLRRPHDVTIRRIVAYVIDAMGLFALLAPFTGWSIRRRGVADGPPPALYSSLARWFSAPTWAAMIAADATSGRTPGKRITGVRAVGPDGRHPTVPRAVVRTAVKLVPWELAHLGLFRLARRTPWDTPASRVVTGTANALLVVWLSATIRSRGARGPHDVVAGTRVVRAGSRIAVREQSIDRPSRR
jgi:uncharacterized RDD family membrane protein YckC